MRFVFTVDGKEVATVRRTEQAADITDDDSKGWEDLLPQDVELSLHCGGKEYTVTMSRSEYQRMIDDGVITTEKPTVGG